jgi:SAM-dependent methyltransferase
MRVRALVKGILTYIPGSEFVLPKTLASRDPPPFYFYGIWLKHLVHLHHQRLDDNPRTVAELGPGDSLGLGIAALLTGADRYFALDVIKHASTESNLRTLEVISGLLRDRAPRPAKGWPDIDVHMDASLFPHGILTEPRLAAAMSEQRLESLRAQLSGKPANDAGIELAYRVPWADREVVEEGSVDLVVSHAVLEHVVDIKATYRALYQWLRPGGVMSHYIDLSAHQLTDRFNGFRSIPEPVWRLMNGRRPYFINRIPCSDHLREIAECGFELVAVHKHLREDGIARSRLSSKWKDIADEDLRCMEVFIQARKPH